MSGESQCKVMKQRESNKRTTAYPTVGSQQAAAIQKEAWKNDGIFSSENAMEEKIKYQILPGKEVVV